ncbi:CatB-related O-acetyltransferase [Desulfocurvibacter africanus]|uniref:Chloramphenicol O-acetyltransferase n=1 Tax=Desulfocurvibacter africanus subsp. africanus str. Walvis Bay TaxID=690850 RepID=F3YZ75_DESAF|nr:CatB-related O-acetyltransferase [Desulfocurvibacter africanus]EGJ50831.1 Chloramphenicol O-acetyltransferase [Desulfocurvibacter africanus subsp. africanus str. Walvis Bay]
MPGAQGPNPETPYPMHGVKRLCFLKNFITRPNILVGDYTYYDDPDGPENFERNVLYHFDFLGDRLIIGKFCAIAAGAKFIMNGGNHFMAGFTTYPFTLFGDGWDTALPKLPDFPFRGDTVVGNDVWLGYDCLLMPGVKIGHGAVVASRSVVTKDVPPYAIVAGNPARVVRTRFDEQTIELLLQIAWWDWPPDKITRHIADLYGNDPERLRALL